ncbi:Cse1 domain-containing protein [Mucor velutinosus]|uniref:Cse1 domain-containing protein n=1 Tax=Mucor velutinosus TaxID=708070 RepID=A0AAN7D617_9FUNG|nr:Cse1 domain-containing protein [Mucor velutinosus]
MKINQKKKMKNTDILSAGSKVYAKKRKAKKETVESVEFDDASRTEFLTGFHKRKVERKNKTKEKYALLAKEEKLRNRREAREQRQRLADKNVQEMAAMLRTSLGGPLNESDKFQSEEEEEEEEEEDKKKEPKVQEFKTQSTLTTVTVIEDLDLENH